MRIEVTGIKKTMLGFAQLQSKVFRKTVIGVNRAARNVKRKSVETAPIDTGTLRKSHRVEDVKSSLGPMSKVIADPSTGEREASGANPALSGSMDDMGGSYAFAAHELPKYSEKSYSKGAVHRFMAKALNASHESVVGAI